MGLLFVEVQSEGVSGELRINDLHVVLVGPGPYRAFVPVPHFVVHGANTLAAVLRESSSAARMAVRLAEFEEGQEFFQEAGREIARLDLTSLDPSPTVHFLGSGPVGWSWNACHRWSDIETAWSDAAAFVVALLDAFERRDAPWIVGMSAPKHRDLGMAFTNRPLTEIESMVSDQIGEGYRLIRPTSSSFRPLLAAGGRLIHLLHADGGDLIRMSDDEGPSSWPAHIGKLEQGWRVIL